MIVGHVAPNQTVPSSGSVLGNVVFEPYDQMPRLVDMKEARADGP